MAPGAPASFGAQLKALRAAAGFTQEELATIAGLSVHAVSALERGERRRPHVETVRALSAALDLTGPARDALLSRACRVPGPLHVARARQPRARVGCGAAGRGSAASVASLRLLVTSRAPRRLRGEREYTLGPLALAVGSEAMSPADLARAPAVRLFLERVRDVRPDFRLTSANGPTVTAICRRLDALPLAIELAAPCMKTLTVEDLLRRLEQDALLSTAGPRDLPERQQTMIAWSYQLLSPGEQRMFRRLGALPGRFPIAAAAAALTGREGSARNEETLRAAAGLIDKTLLLRAESSVATRPLYQTLETVRAYAARQLESAGERDDAREGLARYCTRQASLAAEGLVGPAQVEWMHRYTTISRAIATP